MAAIEPVMQAVDDPLHNIRMIKPQRIAAASHVVVFTLRGKPVVASIIDTTLAQGWAEHIQFSAVVEHHIQNHFDTRFMQRFDRIP